MVFLAAQKGGGEKKLKLTSFVKCCFLTIYHTKSTIRATKFDIPIKFDSFFRVYKNTVEMERKLPNYS